ncbi:SAM-dependent methyltransferase [Campylobacter pinnipediorum subsp. caledonicus]|uniref:SAM-dependent methyltransferase n=1 Tax=Campylobacter pinnipediorum subsp. caledonicus TaxID=1874362 RepID=A0A1S6U9T0_9BACT|nr:class I SAM-dependent methyltransferase [Campylobacter pinnipediorum]AQW86790.1 SAM-dependent methyltransferase [Campylobacter pinnipediorum subsp. caledonicus]AQW88445.1 SAM-dependent methyltransferase [Campylobacter pinnipediorum subsp. caledonicus]
MSNVSHWNDFLQDKKHHARYPESELVSFAFINFPKNGNILDLYCGGGRHTKFLAENGFNTYACDVTTSGVEHTKNLLQESNLKADVKFIKAGDDLPYNDNFFDGIVCYGALYYATKEEIEKSAYEFYRILKNGAKAYIKVRSIQDYRYTNSIKNSKYEIIINEQDNKKQAYKENGLKCYYFDKEEALRIFSKTFKNIQIDRFSLSHGNDTFLDDQLLITLTK